MLDTESCWQAVMRRDRAADGTFLYGVRTVGVYCRPGCPSRRPNRENAVFFADAAAAEAAGFRPCKRCRPDEAAPDARQRRAVEQACRLIRAAKRPPALADLARAVAVSPHHLHRLFRRFTGTTPGAYARAAKLGRFDAALAAGAPIAAAAHDAGYGSSARAYAAADSFLGMTPGARRGGGKGETIRYATGRSDLGRVLVAATARGVCAVEIGDDAAALAAGLAARFPAAALVEDEPALAATLATVVRAVETPGATADLPLDLRGTAFEARVWQALRDIPAGTTTTYAGLAAALGMPGGARAVARACASNAVAVLVPCHRVVGGDGALRGYRWGIERKRALLDRERAGR